MQPQFWLFTSGVLWHSVHLYIDGNPILGLEYVNQVFYKFQWSDFDGRVNSSVQQRLFGDQFTFCPHLFDIIGYEITFFDFKDLVCAFGRDSGLSGQTEETYYFSKFIRLHFATFQSGWWWQQKWGSPEAFASEINPEDVTGCGRHKRRVLLARQTRLGSGAGEVWGAVQLLKEQQAAFQLLTTAAASDGNESCEHKQALPSLEYDRFFFFQIYCLSIIWGSIRQKSALLRRPEHRTMFHFNWGKKRAVKIFLQLWWGCKEI